jgi:hypothetical protein
MLGTLTLAHEVIKEAGRRRRTEKEKQFIMQEHFFRVSFLTNLFGNHCYLV